MAAPPKVSTQAISNALLAWRGDVSAAARQLGLSRNGLYQRIQRLGLDLDGFRNAGGGAPVVPIKVDTTVSRLPPMPTMPTLPASSGRVQTIQKSGRANFSRNADARRVGGVSQGATAAEVEGLPIKTAPARRLPPVKVRPDLRERLQRAAWQLQARFEVATDESLVLEQFIEERLDGWVAEKLEQGRAAANGSKRGAGRKGGAE